MTPSKSILVIITLLAVVASCRANIIEAILEHVFGIEAKQRSMSEIITDFLDELFPKDDMDTKAMKDIFTMYNEEGNNLFDSQFAGTDYMVEK